MPYVLWLIIMIMIIMKIMIIMIIIIIVLMIIMTLIITLIIMIVIKMSKIIISNNKNAWKSIDRFFMNVLFNGSQLYMSIYFCIANHCIRCFTPNSDFDRQ